MKTIRLGLIASSILALSSAMAISDAHAGSRYATPPGLTLSPDVSSPWVLQLSSKRARAIKRAQRQRKARVARTNGQFRVKSHVSGPRLHTASVGSQRTVLRRSITPKFDNGMAPTVVDFYGDERPGTIVVDTIERKLYLVLEGGLARRYAIGVGKPGFEWSGTHKVSRKAEWPDWRPPAEMIAREKKKGRILPKFMAGGPGNPLGSRALYLGSSIYRIHGTNQAWSIGKAVSSGCIRMLNEDVMDLYDRVPVGTRVKVI